MKKETLIILFLLIFSKSLFARTFFETLLSAPCMDRQICLDSLRNLSEWDLDIFDIDRDFILNDKAYILINSCDSFSIYTPFYLSFLKRLIAGEDKDNRIMSQYCVFIDKANKRCFSLACMYDTPTTTNELRRISDDIYLICIENVNWILQNVREFKIGPDKEYVPVMDLGFNILNRSFPECKPCSGDFETISFYNYRDDKRYHRSFNIYNSDFPVYNIRNISYNEFLNLIPVFLEKAKDLPEVEMKSKAAAKDKIDD